MNKKEIEVQAQAQQTEYSNAQSMNRQSSRAYNPKSEATGPIRGPTTPPFSSRRSAETASSPTTIDNVGAFNGLPLSVPAPGSAVLTATLDLNSIPQMLASVAGSPERLLALRDANNAVAGRLEGRHRPGRRRLDAPPGRARRLGHRGDGAARSGPGPPEGSPVQGADLVRFVLRHGHRSRVPLRGPRHPSRPHRSPARPTPWVAANSRPAPGSPATTRSASWRRRSTGWPPRCSRSTR